MKTLFKNLKLILQVILMVCLTFAVSCSSDDGSMDPPIENPDDGDGSGNGDGSGDGSGDGNGGGDGSTTFDPIININAGGDTFVYDTKTFVKDTFFIATSGSYRNAEIVDILQTEMDSIYVTERKSFNDQGEFTYSIPVTNGNYRVILHFAEIYWNAPGGGNGGEGTRVFNVFSEGTLMLDNYDILSEVPSSTATTKTFDIKVEDEELTIFFEAVADNPKVSAIEILGDGELRN